MFNSITWQQYYTAIILLLIIYYIAIGYKLYKWEILHLIGIRKVEDGSLNATSLSNLRNFIQPEIPEGYLPKTALEIDISPLVQSFTDEVKAFVQQTTSIEILKDDLVNSLGSIASKYTALKDADCKSDLELFVLNEVNKIYPNLLQTIDVKKLWN